MKIHILLFYKFVSIKNPASFKAKHLKFCNELGIQGKILVAHEGINGSVSGTKKQVEAYKKELTKDPRFKDIEFKEETGLHHPFDKFVVKIKNEIIRLDKKVNMKNKGEYISPKEFLDLYKKNKDVLIMDTRNDYESKAGRFKGAILAPIEAFREFPKFVKKMSVKKDKPIVMYCTGGIRCEKASAYMKEQGFTNVRQLHGGIIKFCQEYPNTVWEGTCFVFDKRLTSNVGQKNTFNKCLHCKEPCEFYRNCKHVDCNELIFICPKCEKNFHACCSNNCMKILLSGIQVKAS